MNLYKIKKIFQSLFDKIKLKDTIKIDFLDQFSSLLNSGIPITSAIQIINYQTKNKNLKKILNTFSIEINKGANLKEVFGKFPKTFEMFDLSIVEMGELTGKVGDALEVLRNKEEKNHEIKSKILGAMMYPMIIISLSIIMIVIFIVYVIPKITDMYKDAHVNLPKLTQYVIKISDFLQANIFYLVILFFIFTFILTYLKNNGITKYYFDKYVLKVPVFGLLIKKKILSLFTFSLGTLLKNGVIINKSLEISSGTINNDYYKNELKKVISGISAGEDFSKMLGIENIKDGKENQLFPIELASAVKIGEQTGKLPELLLKFSIKYNKDIDNTVKNLSTIIEPVVIIIVGIIIGTLIMAILLPFFNMVNVM